MGIFSSELRGDTRPSIIKSPCNRVFLLKTPNQLHTPQSIYTSLNSVGSVTNSSSSVSASLSSPTCASDLDRYCNANFDASCSPNPQHTKLPFAKTNISPSLPFSPHFGTHHDSWRVRDCGGRRPHSLDKT